jgi:uncharacterized SAM-binding protein YcdF (DUF218 family)
LREGREKRKENKRVNKKYFHGIRIILQINENKITMFFALSKIIDFILLPICWIFILLLISSLTKSQKSRKRSLLSVLVILTLFSNPWFVNRLYVFYEQPTISLLQSENYTWGIVLGGGMIRPGDEDQSDKINVGETADRFIQPILLYKAGKIKKILITGGNTSIGKIKVDKGHETSDVRQLMISMGVNPKDIYMETKARNTRENALYSAQKLKNYIKSEEVLLITSAMHMPRSIRCFEKVGFKVKAYPVDKKGSKNESGLLDLLTPSDQNLSRTSQLIREISGLIIYMIMGYC